jgi:hypothetical protein
MDHDENTSTMQSTGQDFALHARLEYVAPQLLPPWNP